MLFGVGQIFVQKKNPSLFSFRRKWNVNAEDNYHFIDKNWIKFKGASSKSSVFFKDNRHLKRKLLTLKMQNRYIIDRLR